MQGKVNPRTAILEEDASLTRTRRLAPRYTSRSTLVRVYHMHAAGYLDIAQLRAQVSSTQLQND